MKILSIAFITLLAATPAFAADHAPEIKNGDFENGKQFWKGEGKAVFEKALSKEAAEKSGIKPAAPKETAPKPGTDTDGNKVWELKASNRGGDAISQDIDMGKLTKLEITLRMKSVGYEGAGLRVTMKPRSGSSTFNIREVSDGEWKDFKMVYNRNGTEEKYTLIITPMMGKGSIQIDDVKVTGGTAAPKAQ